jgi:hypothetical protein
MPKKRRVTAIVIELLILGVFAGILYRYNFRLTLFFYLIAVFLALFRGLIFRRKNISWMIIFGTILSYIAGILFWKALDNYFAGDIISAAILGLLIFYLFRKSMRLKKGKK